MDYEAYCKKLGEQMADDGLMAGEALMVTGLLFLSCLGFVADETAAVKEPLYVSTVAGVNALLKQMQRELAGNNSNNLPNDKPPEPPGGWNLEL